MAKVKYLCDIDVGGEVKGASLDINGAAAINGKVVIEGDSAAWNVTTPGATTGSLHFDPGATTNDFGNAITFGASDSNNGTTGQAGIYLRTDGAYGTRMYFATTNDYATGSKTSFYINNDKKVYFLDDIVVTGSVTAGGTTLTGAQTTVSGSSGSCTGNAATATTLATARNIGGVSFNGSSAINLPGVNTGGNQNTSGSSASCTGNAATATALTSGNKSITGTFTVSGNINANGNIVGDDGTSITNITDIECDTIGSDADNTTVVQLNAADMAFLVADNDMMQLSTTTATMYGIVDITGTTDATNATGDTGILRCEGGASIAKKLYVGSTITGSADVIAFSDRKLKENIETLDGKKVLDMRGVSFTRKDTGAESSGVIAQEIQKVAPELVHDTEGTLGVAYGNLVGYLIEAVKDQQKQIDELKAMINGSSR